MPPVETPSRHTNVDAYRIIPYDCDQCASHLDVWNGADMPPPPAIFCFRCGGGEHPSRLSMIRNYQFTDDSSYPDYTPRKGELVFLPMTREKAEITARMTLREQEERGIPAPLGTDRPTQLRRIEDQLFGDGKTPELSVVL